MTTQVIWRTNPYTGKEVWTYGNYGGPGWCGGKFLPPGTEAEFTLDGKDRLDEIFKAHDLAYNNVEKAFASSGKTQADLQKEALDILKADDAMLASINTLLKGVWPQGSTVLTEGELNGAVEAKAVFEAKRLYDMARLVANQPGLGIDGDPFTGLPLRSDNDALITELQIRFTTAKTIDPIILDLNGDGVQTSKLSKSLSRGVHFNLDAKGLAENTGWVDTQDGLLVRDIDGDGRITSGRELFGNHTLLTKGVNAGKESGNGFEALKELDDNNDGVVDSKDAAFNTLKVWRDADGDAATDADELLTLAQASVKSLKVAYTSGTSTDVQGNAHQQLGSFTMTNGVTRNMDDVWFSVDTARTVETNLVSVSAAIQALPNLANMGNVLSLHQAMARDATGQIQTLLQQWQSSYGAKREEVLDKLIYQWAGVQDMAPTSRGVYMDARQLGVLEGVLGADFVRPGVGANPSNSTIAQPLIQAYNLLHLQVGSELFWQTDASELLSKIKLSWVDADLRAGAGTQAATAHFEWSARPLADALHARFIAGSLQDGIQDVQLFVTALKHHNGDPVLQALQTQANQYTDVYGVLLQNINFFVNSSAQIGTDSSDRLSASNVSFLMGLAGNDTMAGSSASDVLIGGVGNDSLDGSLGNDIYIFSKGDGADTIADYDYTTGNIDILKLGDGLFASEAQVSSSGLDLKLSWGVDSVVLQNYLYSDAYRVEKISFADGTVWGLADIAERLTRNGGVGADSITGLTNYANRINGLGGDDYLYGGNKDDTLAGGVGNDRLVGGGGADRFVFSESLEVGNADVIGDFSVSQGDMLVLDARFFKKLANLTSLNGNFRFNTQVAMGGR